MSNQQWVVAGSDLYTGQVIYLSLNTSEESEWVYQITQAKLLNQEESQTALNVARIDHKKNRVVDPYLIQVQSYAQLEEDSEIEIEPLKKREKMRITGPSIREDLPPFPPRSY